MNALIDESGEIRANENIGPDLYLMSLALPNIAATVQPGQFVHMKLPCFEQHILRRPFSIYARSASKGTIDILYQAVGEGTRHMTTLRQGDAVLALGPIGSVWELPKEARSALLIGGGVGAAPLFMFAEYLQESSIDFDVILGARTKDTHICYERYEALMGAHAIEEDAPLRCATDDGSFGFVGVCTPLVEHALARKRYDYVAVCGPEPMMRAVWGLVRETSIPCQMSFERRMACGIGACLSCVIETHEGNRRACVDGPIFDARKVVF